MDAVEGSSKATAAASGIEATSAAVAGTRRRKTELVKVGQGIIDALLARPKVESCGCFACFPAGDAFFDDLADILEPEEVEGWRAQYAATAATFKNLHDRDDSILEQYKEKGYAVVEVEVQDAADAEEAGHY